MKILMSRSFVLTLTLLVCTYGAQEDPYTIVGDIKIRFFNGTIYCDSMICPPGSLACHVTKRNDPNDASKIVRTRRCFANNSAIVAHESKIEPNDYDGSINIAVVSGGGDPSIVRPHNVKVREAGEELRPLQDGRFNRKLRERIQNEIHENFRHSFISS